MNEQEMPQASMPKRNNEEDKDNAPPPKRGRPAPVSAAQQAAIDMGLQLEEDDSGEEKEMDTEGVTHVPPEKLNEPQEQFAESEALLRAILGAGDTREPPVKRARPDEEKKDSTWENEQAELISELRPSREITPRQARALVGMIARSSKTAATLVHTAYTLAGSARHRNFYELADLSPEQRARLRFASGSERFVGGVKALFAALPTFAAKHQGAKRYNVNLKMMEDRVPRILQSMMSNGPEELDKIHKYFPSTWTRKEMVDAMTAPYTVERRHLRLWKFNPQVATIHGVPLAVHNVDFKFVEKEEYTNLPVFTRTGVDQGFLSAVNLLVRSMANYQALHESKEVADLEQSDFDRLADEMRGLLDRASRFQLTSGTSVTYIRRFWTGLFVNRVCNLMRSIQVTAPAASSWFEPFGAAARSLNRGVRTLNGASEEDKARIEERYSFVLHECEYTTPDPARADCTWQGFSDYVVRQYGRAQIPGFGAWVDTSGSESVVRSNVMRWVSSVYKIQAEPNEADDYDVSYVMAMSQAEHAAGNEPSRERVLEVRRAIAKADLSKWTLNPVASSGPVFRKLPNRSVEKQLYDLWLQDGDFWDRAFARGNAAHIPNFNAFVVGLFNGISKNELLEVKPVTTAGGDMVVEPKSSRIIYSGCRNLPEASFMGVFSGKVPPQDTDTIYGVNLLTGGGMRLLFDTIVTKLEARAHWFYRMSDNTHGAVRVKRYRSRIFQREIWDFQHSSGDIKSMEAANDPAFRVWFWRALIRKYNADMAARGWMTMPPVVEAYLIDMIDKKSNFTALLGAQYAVDFMLGSGQSDTTALNDASTARATYLLNSIDFPQPANALIRFEAKNPDGSDAHQWNDHAATTGVKLSQPSVPVPFMAAMEALGLILKLESVVGDSKMGIIELLETNMLTYYHADILGFGVAALGSDEPGAMATVIPVLAPDRMAASLAYAKSDILNRENEGSVLDTDNELDKFVIRCSKAVSIMMMGGFLYEIPRTISFTMMLQAVASFRKTIPESMIDSAINGVDIAVADVLEQAGVVGSNTSMAGLVNLLLTTKTLALRWFLDKVTGMPRFVDTLAPMFPGLFNGQPPEGAPADWAPPPVPQEDELRPEQLFGEDSKTGAHATLDQPRLSAGESRFVEELAQHGFFSVSDIVPRKESTAESRQAALTAARTVLSNPRKLEKLVIPGSVSMPPKLPTSKKRTNFRPLAWMIAYRALPDDVKQKFGVKDWFQALHELETGSDVRYSFEQQSFADFLKRTSPESMPEDPSMAGFMTHVQKKRGSTSMAEEDTEFRESRRRGGRRAREDTGVHLSEREMTRARESGASGLVTAEQYAVMEEMREVQRELDQQGARADNFDVSLEAMQRTLRDML